MARYLQKEWLPLDDGWPGIVHILQEVAALGPRSLARLAWHSRRLACRAPQRR
ncbi:hypothetical protein [Nonomuraea recticatena]|uniref:hypothetical protein n=1 Tax=Nonomuraea recticatena TaxID=46178 RepID=UPI0031F92CF0